MSAAPAAKPDWGRGATTALLIGGTAGAFAAFGSPILAIHSPGPLPLLILATVLLVVRPQIDWRGLSPMVRGGCVLLGAGLLIPFIAALGIAPEKEAALLASPRWAFLLGALVLGVALRGAQLPVICATLIATAALRTWGAWQSGLDWTIEATWWIPSLLWMVGVAVVMRTSARKSLPESAPLLAAMAWFVLVLLTMTIQESRHPSPHFFAQDRDSLIAAVAQKPIIGWGLGGAERVFLETSLRDPREAPLAARAVLRLAAEIGLLPMLLLAAGGLLLGARGLRDGEWNAARLVSLGVAGFFLMSMASGRGDWAAHLAILALTAAASIAPASTTTRRSASWTPALIGALPALLIALLIRGGRVHYESQNPRENIGAWSYLWTWTTPLREQALLERDQQETRPERLEAIARRWIAASPHDEYAWIELVRVLHVTQGPTASTPVIEDATRRLPWSDALAAWRRRILVEGNRPAEALQYLEELRAKRGSLPPALHRRLLELRLQMREATTNAP